MKAFLSYQTGDKAVAGKIKNLLESVGVEGFLAHEDIRVSEEWRLKLLEELGDADLFVPILSKNYFGSIWCAQESGIASADPDITIVPVSIDETVSSGFFGHIQSTTIDANNPQLQSLRPGLFKCDKAFTIDALVALVGKSGSYRGAEYAFGLISPYLNAATDEQKTELLKVSTNNNQVCNAGECATKFLPPLLASHGKFLAHNTRSELEATLARYNKP